jgi:hypothetical protein
MEPIDLARNTVYIDGERYLASPAGTTKLGGRVRLPDGRGALVVGRRTKRLGFRIELTFKTDDGALLTRSYGAADLIAWG